MTTAMDELSQWINDWIGFAQEARQRLSIIHGCEIDPLDFQEFFRELYGLEHSTDMLYMELPSVDEIVEKLRAAPFAPFAPFCSEVIEEIHLENRAIPESFPHLLTEETIKNSGERWRIHKNDVDPFPSSPHAHNLHTGLKLHLGTGRLYFKWAERGQISCKDLEIIRNKVKKIALPHYECK